jgi:hypothetical protein
MSNVLKSTMIGVGVVLILLAKLISLGEKIDRVEEKINSFAYNTPHQSYVDTIFVFEIAYEDEITDEELIEAIIEVESNGNPNAYNEGSGATGCMQIMPIMVNEVNRICKLTKNNKYFYPKDRWDCGKSKEMFMIWKNYHHKTSPPETIARHWWGGPHYGDEDCSLFYWKRVKKNLEA